MRQKFIEEPIVGRIDRQQLGWFGHIVRMEDAKFAKKLYRNQKKRYVEQMWTTYIMDKKK